MSSQCVLKRKRRDRAKVKKHHHESDALPPTTAAGRSMVAEGVSVRQSFLSDDAGPDYFVSQTRRSTSVYSGSGGISLNPSR